MKKEAKINNSLNKRNLPWIYFFMLPSLLIFLLFYVTPIITVFTTSFTKWDGFNAPSFIGFANYTRLFSLPSFAISMKNLLCWGLIAGTVHVGFGVLVAFVLHKKPFGWRFVRTVFMVPNVISAAAWAMIYRFIFNNDFGILNNLIRFFNPDFNRQWFFESPYAFWAITFTWVFYAVIVTLIVLADLLAIPQELHEAASIDGATEWDMTFRINIPLCRNSIGTGVLLSITSRIGMYEAIVLTSRGGPGDDTMNLPLILVKAISDMNYGYANATAVFMFVLGIVIMLVVNKLFRMNESVY